MTSNSESESDDESHENKTEGEYLTTIINKASGISRLEKKFIFEYIMAKPPGESLEKYAKNLMITVNSFFEYGFKP